MRSSKVITATPQRLILAVVFALTVPAAFAQTPPADNRDDMDVTMRTIGNPDAIEPDEIVRKIPQPKAKKRVQGTDDRADDLARPGENGGENGGGSAADPETPVVPAAPDDTGTPVDPRPSPGPDPSPSPSPSPGVPEVPNEGGPGSGPDPRENPDNLGHQVSEDAQHHGQDAHQNSHHSPGQDHSPSGPKSKPPEPKHPDPKPPKPPSPKHPDPKPPSPGDHGPKDHGPKDHGPKDHGPKHGPGPG